VLGCIFLKEGIFLMSGNTVFSGNLSFTNLADIFQILGGNSSSGVLKVSSRYTPNIGIIRFRKGEAFDATYGSLQGVEAIYNMFGITDGRYEFFDQDVSQLKNIIGKSLMEIVLDALRMLDDGDIPRVGPPTFVDDGINTAKSDGKEILPVIKGPFSDYRYVVREEFFKDGEQIVKEGKHGKWIWSIYQGSAKVIRETDRGSLVVARLGEGCFVGTFKSLSFGDYERNASVIAEGDATLCLLDSEPFYKEYAFLSHNFRKLLLSLDSRLKNVTDRAVELYSSDVGCNELRKDNNRAFENVVPSQDDLYSITEGSANIVGNTSKGELSLVPLNKDDIFGNIPFLDFGHEPRSASVLGSNDLKVDKLDIKYLQEEYNSLSQTFRNLIYNIGTYISMTTNLVYKFHNRN
jgi:hypothetical protein